MPIGGEKWGFVGNINFLWFVINFLLFQKNKKTIDELIKSNYELVNIIDDIINEYGNTNRTNVVDIGTAIKHELTRDLDSHRNTYIKSYSNSLDKLIALLGLLKRYKCHYYDFHLNNFMNLKKFISSIVNENDNTKLGGIFEKYKLQHGIMSGLLVGIKENMVYQQEIILQ